MKGSYCTLEDNHVYYATRGGILLFTDPGKDRETTNCVVRNNRLNRNSQWGIEVMGENHLIEGNEIWGTIQHHPSWVNAPSTVDADGIRFFGSGHTFRGNYVYDISRVDPENIDPHVDAFQTWDDDLGRAGNNCIFEKNKVVLGMNSAGFQLEGGTHDLVIRNNVIQAMAGARSYANKKSPYSNPSQLGIANNLFIQATERAPEDSPVGLTLQDAKALVVENNIFLDQIDRVINVSGSLQTDVSHNLAYNSDRSMPRYPDGAPVDQALCGVNPFFTSPSAADRHLQAGSPAIDAGASLPDVQDDFDGVARP